MARGCLAVMGQASDSDDASDGSGGGGGGGGGGELLYRSLGEVAWRTGAPLKDGEGEEEAGEEGREEGLSLFPSGLCEEDALAMSRSRPRAGRLPLSHRRPAARTPVFQRLVKRKQPWAAWRRRGPSAWWWRSKLLGPRLL